MSTSLLCDHYSTKNVFVKRFSENYYKKNVTNLHDAILTHKKRRSYDRPSSCALIGRRLVCLEREKRRNACALDGNCKLALVLCAGARHSAGEDLAALGNVLSQLVCVFIVDFGRLFLAEEADLFEVLLLESLLGGALSRFASFPGGVRSGGCGRLLLCGSGCSRLFLRGDFCRNGLFHRLILHFFHDVSLKF